MENVLAQTLGDITARAQASHDWGDYIDLGLILRRLLEEHGFGLVVLGPTRSVDAGPDGIL